MGGISAKSETAKNFYVFTGGDKSIKQHSWKFHNLIHSYKDIHEKDIINIQMLPPYSLEFFTCSYDNYLKQWDTKTGELIHDYGKIDEDMVRVMLVTPDGHFIFTAHRDHTVRQYSVEFKKCMKVYEDIHEGSVDAMVATPCGNYLYTAGRDMK